MHGREHPQLDISKVTAQLQLTALGTPTQTPERRKRHQDEDATPATSPPSRRCIWPDNHPNSPAFLHLRSNSGKSEPQNITPKDWAHLPADVMGIIVPHLSLSDIKSSRLACREWQRTVSRALRQLRPRSLQPSAVATIFPSLQRLELRRCKKLGDADLLNLNKLITLSSLNLEGCEDITDQSADQITGLTRLRSLSLRNCVKISDLTLHTISGDVAGAHRRMSSSLNGSPRLIPSPRKHHHFGLNEASNTVSMHNSNTMNGAAASLSASTSQCSAPRCLTYPAQLASLDLSGCIWVTEHGMHAVASGFIYLTSLCIGGCNRVSTVSDGMLIPVGRCKELKILDLSGCTNITNGGFSHIRGLTNLQQLSMWNCLRLTPQALTTLCDMTGLTDLSLRGCQQMTDEALTHLSGLRNLCKLDMRACEHLRGEELTRLAKLDKLTDINLRGCYALNDAGLASLGKLKSLRNIHLQECWQITAAGLGSLAGLTVLQELNLQGCRNLVNAPNTSLPSLDKMTALTSLSIKNCERLQEGCLTFITALTNLKQLDLSGCKELPGSSLDPLASATKLASLKLQHCSGLRGPNALNALRPLYSLTSLHLGGCTGLVGTAFTSLQELQNLEYLSLEGCKNIPLFERAVAAIGCCSSLTSLSFQGCNSLTDEGLAFLGKLNKLSTFVGSDCPDITGTGFKAWCYEECSSNSSTTSTTTSNSLTSLQLQGCLSLNDDGASALAHLEQLRELNMKNCRAVTDVGIEAISTSLNKLTSLSLQGKVGLTDRGVSSLSSLRSLQDLELQFCWQFGDDGLSALRVLPSLSRLDLMYSWKITDDVLGPLRGMTSLLSLNVLGCHRLTPVGKESVSHLLEGASQL